MGKKSKRRSNRSSTSASRASATNGGATQSLGSYYEYSDEGSREQDLSLSFESVDSAMMKAALASMPVAPAKAAVANVETEEEKRARIEALVRSELAKRKADEEKQHNQLVEKLIDQTPKIKNLSVDQVSKAVVQSPSLNISTNTVTPEKDAVPSLTKSLPAIDKAVPVATPMKQTNDTAGTNGFHSKAAEEPLTKSRGLDLNEPVESDNKQKDCDCQCTIM